MILLHSCCGPCSAAVLPEFKQTDVVVYFYNPSILSEEEYYKRVDAQSAVCKYFGVELVVVPYNHFEFLAQISDYRGCPEQGSRCTLCFYQRFILIASIAKSKGIEQISTTLTVSPYKDSIQILNELSRAARNTGVKYLNRDFKGCVSTLPFEIYEQEFCGCEYSFPAKPIQVCERKCNNCLKDWSTLK